MFSQLCLAFTLQVTTGQTVSAIDLAQQECHSAKMLCVLKDDKWIVNREKFVSRMLTAKWQLTTLRTRVEVKELRCEETIYKVVK